MIFWVLAGLMSAGVALALLAAPRRGASGEADALPGLIRAELTALDSDIARGTISADEAGPLRAEIQRRLLRRPPKAATFLTGQGGLAALSVALLPVGAALLVYLVIGQPGMTDQPLTGRIDSAMALYQSRPHQAEAEGTGDEFRDDAGKAPLQDLSLIARLRTAVAERPDDVKGLTLLASSEAQLENFRAAWQAQAQSNRLEGSVVSDESLALQAMWMVRAAQNLVTPEAEAVIKQALDRNPKNDIARYYLGLLYFQIGRPDIAYSVWDAIYQDQEAGGEFVAPLEQEMPFVAELAGTRFQTRPELEVQTETPPDINAMVEGLYARLTSEGGEVAEWQMLVRSLMVQGDIIRAGEVVEAGKTAFAADPAAQDAIQKVFDDAGVLGSP